MLVARICAKFISASLALLLIISVRKILIKLSFYLIFYAHVTFGQRQKKIFQDWRKSLMVETQQSVADQCF